jgi:molybdopterin-guanine dinucleotide biosynthesis protein A
MAENNLSTNHPLPNLGAVILHGGKSTRMGVDKSQLVFQGDTLFGHVLTQVAKFASPLVIAGGTDSSLTKKSPPVIFVKDQRPDVGPLEGIRVGLTELGPAVEFAFITGCDAPLIKPRLIAHLFELIEDYQAIVPVQGDRVFGMTAIYRTDIAEDLQTLIDQKQHRVRDLARHFDALQVDLESLKEYDPGLDSFININSREDYEHLLKRFTHRKNTH